MTIKDIELQISDSGKVAILRSRNGRLIAELLVHGPLLKCAMNAHDNIPIVSGRANIYRGEIFGLAGYEFLNIEEEWIEEK